MSTNPPPDPTRRFSSRAENYAKYRPGYPSAVLDLLRDKCHFTPATVVADIGSGTGILTEMMLQHGNPVFAVEPNREMREAAERELSRQPGFHSVDARAEATTLPTGSIDLITASQAFHWFKPDEARQEFLRILKPGGWVALIWNERHGGSDSFLEAYERLLIECATGYTGSGHHHAEAIAAFFGPAGFREATFPNWQRLDFEGLKGRLLSSSYAPEPGHPQHLPMLDALETVFRHHQSEGKITFKYDTLVFYGRLTR
jgi:SAM-dependent methyltransferase